MTAWSALGISTLDPRGPAAREIASLWWLMFAMGVGIFVFISVAMILGFVRRRPNRSELTEFPRYDPEQHTTARRRWIVYGGVVMPVVVLLIVFGAAVKTTLAINDDNRATTMSVDVVAHQWWWEMRYGDRVVANELHIPSNERVLVRLSSNDVIHSLWIPQLNGKLDALPDHTNTLILEADDPGTYQGRCAEFCGLHHAEMPFVVIAHTRAEFDAWLASEEAT
jgi:cytochrome c oxidase subunit II